MSGRRPKLGLEYAPWDVDIFENDTKIDKLIDTQGLVGFCIYFYLCQRAYASDGYFYRWSYADAATTARRLGGGIRSETVRSTVGTCSQVGLFNKRLLDVEGILTSKGIQRSYVAAVQKRSYRTVIKEYWLLEENESKGMVFVPKNSVFLSENGDFLPENGNNLSESATKKSKVKKSKVNTPLPPTTESAPERRDMVYFPDNEKLNEAFVEYLAFRRNAGKPEPTMQSIDRLIQKLYLLSHDPGEMILILHQSIDQGWSGLYKLGVDTSKKDKGSKKAADGFHNFEERKYDYDELEKRFVKNLKK